MEGGMDERQKGKQSERDGGINGLSDEGDTV